jgi:hypothetical protein
MQTPFQNLKNYLQKTADAFQKEGKDITDDFFPYVYKQASAQPQWQKAIIKFMPRRSYMEGREIWIRVGDGVQADGTNTDTGEEVSKIVYITNLNGPDEEEDVIGMSRNMIERQSGPNDFSWDDIERIPYAEWDKGIVECTEEQEKEIAEKLEELKAWHEESIRIYAEWLQKKDYEIELGLMDREGREMIR